MHSTNLSHKSLFYPKNQWKNPYFFLPPHIAFGRIYTHGQTFIYRIERWRISEYLMIRDTTIIPNILWFEYVTIRGEVNTRKKASARKNN